MTPQENIYNILSKLRSDNGKNHKVKVLQENSANKDLQKFLKLVLDPLTKFHIKKIPKYAHESSSETFESVIEGLELLSSRKITGLEAIQHLSNMLSNSDASLQHLIKLIIEKDLDCGVQTSIVNNVFGSTFIKEAPYMGARSYSKKDVAKLFEKEKSNGLVSQLKADGRYANVIIDNGMVYAEARSGIETDVLGAFDFMGLVEEKFGEPCVTNGEIIIQGIPRYASNGVISSFVSINSKICNSVDVSKDIKKFNDSYKEFGIDWENVSSKLTYVIWDVIPLETYKTFGEFKSKPYGERFKFIQENLTNAHPQLIVVESLFVSTVEEAMVHFQKLVSSGEEGTILKSLSESWFDGKPSFQIKFKLEIEIDLYIEGFLYGEEGTKNESLYSRINCTSEASEGKVLTTTASGMKEAVIEYVTNSHENLVGTVITIVCSGLSRNKKGEYSCLHPRVHPTNAFRDDKTKANTLDECISIQNAALGLTF